MRCFPRITVKPFLLAVLLTALNISGASQLPQPSPADDTSSSPSLVVQSGHNGGVRAFAFSPDGELLASASSDNTVILWRVSNGLQLRSFKGHSAPVSDVAFSRDGRTLASVSNGGDYSINLWDASSGRLLKKIPIKASIGEIKFDASGKILLGLNTEAFGDDAGDTYKAQYMSHIGKVYLWDTATGKALDIVRSMADTTACSPTEPVIALAEKFVPQFRTWEVSYKEQESPFSYRTQKAFSPKIKLLDLKTGRVLRELKGHDGRILKLAFSPDGKLLASAGEDKKIKLWDRNSGQLLFETPELPSAPYTVSFGPDGKTLFGVQWDGSVLAINTGSRRRRVILKIKSWGVLGPGARSIAVAEKDSLELWKPGGKKPAWSAPEHGEAINAVAVNSSSTAIAVVNSSGTVFAWRPYRSRYPITLGGGDDSVQSLGFTPTGEAITGEGKKGEVKRWSLGADKQLSEYKCGSGVPFTFGGDGQLFSLVPFPDWDASIRQDMTLDSDPRQWGRPRIQILDAKTCRPVTLPAGGETISAAALDRRSAISPKGILASVGATYNIPVIAFGGPPSAYRWSPTYWTELDYPLRLIRLADAQVLDTLVGKTYGLTTTYGVLSGRINSLAFSNSGDLLAAGGGYGMRGHIDIWDVLSKSLRKRLEEDFEVRAVAFNPRNEKQLVSAGRSPVIILWDIESGEKRFLRGHTDEVIDLAFSRDGRFIISGSKDNTTKLWDPVTGNELASIVSNGAADQWIVTTPEGLFDTNRIERGGLVHWVMKDDPFNALPVEILMRDYFEPDLLRRVLRSVLKNEPLRKVRPLADLNRAQPTVEILGVKPEPGRTDEAAVTVEVTNRTFTYLKDGGEVKRDSGAYDLRLFRDGKLVGEYPAPADAQEGGASELSNPERTAWRKANRIELNSETGKFTYTFHNIHLPRCAARKVEFTAYAFNEDRVKSETAPPYPYDLPAAAANRCRRAYVITVGVDANQSGWNLEFAAKSARDMGQALSSKLAADYEVVDVQLLSTFKDDDFRPDLTEATKENLHAVLDILAGKDVPEEKRKEVDAEKKLCAATPDDMVVLYVSSHGYVDPQGNFYLIPYNSGRPRGVSEEILNGCLSGANERSRRCMDASAFLLNSISTSDLSGWWKGVDAGEVVMILDSCYSASVPGRSFRPGPLGDRGFGQLSYDKGMLILAAAQPDKTAYATLRLGSGRSLLADTLITYLSANPKQTLSSCLKETEARVPEQYKLLYPNTAEEDIQSPVLLDFTSKR